MESKARGENSSGIEQADDLVWSVGLKFGLLSFNDAARHFFEIHLSGSVKAGMLPGEVHPVEQVPLWTTLYKRTLQEGAFRVEHEFGKDLTLEIFFSPIVARKKVTGVLVRCRDVRHALSGSQAQREAEQKYREIVDRALEGIFRIASDNRLVSANPAFARILGYDSVEDVLHSVGETVENMWVDGADRRRLIEQVQEEGVVRNFESRLKRRDGSVLWASLSVRLVPGADGLGLDREGLLEDITERRQRMKELEKREARQRRIFQENRSIMLLIDPDQGEIVDANVAAAKYYGYPQAQLVGMNLSEINMLPADQMTAECQRAVHEERRIFLFPHRLASGEIREVEVESTPISMDGKDLLFSVIHDVTDRKHTEQLLQESEERYRATFEQAAIGIVHTTFDGRILCCNPHYAEILGYSVGELLGKRILELTYPEDSPSCGKMLRQMVTGEIDWSCLEKRYVRKDGSPVWVRTTASKQRDQNGEPHYFIAFVEDISAHKTATDRLAVVTEAMQASEDRYRTAFQTSLDAIAINRVHDGLYIDVNRAFFEVAGYTREDVIGHTSIELGIWVNPQDRERLALALRENSVCRNLEAQFRKKDGSIFWGLASSAVMEVKGEICHLSVLRDVSEAKAAGDRLAGATQALKVSEERYRTSFQTSFDAIAITRLDDGRYIDSNQAHMRVFGYERDEIVGKSTIEMNIWANPADRLLLLDVIRRDASCRDLEFQFMRKGGQVFDGLISSTRIELDGVPCILSVIRDISESKRAEMQLAASADALRRSEARYRTAFQTSFDAISLSRLADGMMIDVNEAYLQIYGFKREELLGKTSISLGVWAHPSDRIRISQLVRNEGVCLDLEVAFKRRNGEIFPAMLSATEIELDGVRCVLSVIRDVSAAKAAEERMAAAARALRLSEQRYRTVFQAVVDGFFITHLEDGVYIDANQAFVDLLGYQLVEIIGASPSQIGIWEDAVERRRLVDDLRENRTCLGVETRFRKKNGKIFWGRLSASAIEIDGKPCMLSILRDISDARATEEKIRNLAFFDPLTHLPNRRLLIDVLHQALTESAHTGSKRALLFLDLDDFKMVNDTLGHRIGDLMLNEVARRMKACVRKLDTVARLGGDEFVAMLDDLGPETEEAAGIARAVAEQLLVAVRLPYMLAGHECRIDCSIGVTVFGNEQESVEDVLQQADIAMYEAKVVGHGSLHFFAPALQVAVNARATLSKDLRYAIQNDEFRLFYQPQVFRDRLMGAEALIRWAHPTRGLLGPYDFIPFAEETGQILAIGTWVLDTACEQIACWGQRQDTAHLSVSVNISARQFREPDFVALVLKSVERAGINPWKLKLELTESTFLESTDEVIAKMTTLRSHGICFSLDDFGTGYSSLSYLKRLPLEQLKVDSAFVRDILQDATSAAIAQAVISLGKAMRLMVIAEGVETEEQRKFLASLGCHAYQGYLISKPIPVDKFEELAANMEAAETGVQLAWPVF